MVLVDRGGRELPIAANFVGQHMQLPPNQILALEKTPQGGFEFTLEERAA